MELDSQTTEDKPKSKQLVVKPVMGCFEVSWEGGGEIPVALSGKFTSLGATQKAIDTWQASKWPNKRRVRDKVRRHGQSID